MKSLMGKERKPRSIYLWTEHLDYCKRNLDLNDYLSCHTYLYPHKDNLENLTKVVEHSAYEELQRENEELKTAIHNAILSGHLPVGGSTENNFRRLLWDWSPL